MFLIIVLNFIVQSLYCFTLLDGRGHLQFIVNAAARRHFVVVYSSHITPLLGISYNGDRKGEMQVLRDHFQSIISVVHPGHPNWDVLHLAIALNFYLCIDCWQASRTEMHINKSNSTANAVQVEANLQEQLSDHLHFRQERAVLTLTWQNIARVSFQFFLQSYWIVINLDL